MSLLSIWQPTKRCWISARQDLVEPLDKTSPRASNISLRYTGPQSNTTIRPLLGVLNCAKPAQKQICRVVGLLRDYRLLPLLRRQHLDAQHLALLKHHLGIVANYLCLARHQMGTVVAKSIGSRSSLGFKISI